MAINIRRLCRLNLSLASNILSNRNFINVQVRSLYAAKDLGVPLYENLRYVFRNQFMSIEDTFRLKMKEICEKEDGIVYTEDLKAMLHLTRETEEDMELTMKMLEKYIKGQESRKVTPYAFGPVVMRMFYYLNQPHRALAVFNNEELSSNFDYRSSFRILMCLLYKHNMFKEMREAYDKILNTKGMQFIGSSSVLLYAGCMKENTPEALEYAFNQWKSQFKLTRPSLRSSCLLSYLAIKNNAPEIALEILSLVSQENAMSVRSLKLMTYMSMQRYMQVIPLLRHSIENDSISQKLKYFADVIYDLEEKLKIENIPESSELVHLINELKSRDLLEMHCTLEEYLVRPMVISKTNPLKPGMGGRQVTRPEKATIGLKNYL